MGLLKPAWMSKNSKKAVKAVEKITDQQKLEMIAKSNVDTSARTAAVKKLTNQNLLSNITGVRDIGSTAKDRLVDLRKIEVSALTDREKLVDIAKNEEDWPVRKTAIETLADKSLAQKLYVYNVINEKDWSVSKAAIEELTCQDALAQIVKNIDDWRIYLVAFEKLTDQAILADIASSKDVKTDSVRMEAAKRLADQALAQKMYADIANSKYINPECIRMQAAEKLTDQTLAQKIYACIATNAGDAAIRAQAAERLSDEASNQALIQKAYIDAAINSNSHHAIKKLTEPAEFAEVAKNATNRDIGKKAVEMLTDQFLLADVAKHTKHDQIQYAAVLKLNDQAALADVVMKIKDQDARKVAVEKLTDQSALADVAKNDTNDKLRKAAVEKLTDQSALAYIVKNEKRDGHICISAANKLTDNAQAQKAYAHIAKHEVYPANITKYAYTAYGPLLEAVGNLTDQALLADVAKNANCAIICLEAMKKAGLLCEQHKWVNAGQCRKKCTVCGVGSYNHDYEQTSYDGSGADVSMEGFTCTKCGHRGWASGAGSDLESGYFLE